MSYFSFSAGGGTQAEAYAYQLSYFEAMKSTTNLFLR